MNITDTFRLIKTLLGSLFFKPTDIMELPKISFKIAVAQISPVFSDREGKVKKTIRYIEQLARNSTKLFIFPEAILPDYPEHITTVTIGNKTRLNKFHIILLKNKNPITEILTNVLNRVAEMTSSHRKLWPLN